MSKLRPKSNLPAIIWTNYTLYENGKIWSRIKQKFLKASIDPSGYRKVCLFYGDKKYWRRVHRLVAQKYIPNPENKRTVNHKNGIKSDNNVSNLEWATQKENMIHARETGLLKLGECSPNAKLTEGAVIAIRKMKAEIKITDVKLGKIFGVSNDLIGAIVKRKSWKHVK